ncbi:MAG: hemerythrin domain-containing protein [Deltaproteobacteria bacterium]|nr:hemerythrin domain-containing protein [Deltaproteobacteria bacterium]
MKITDALLGEHGLFYAQFDLIEARLTEGAGGENIRGEAAALGAALVSHARIENEILLGALEPHLGRGSGPVAVMRDDHEQIEGLFEGFPETASADEIRRHLLHAIRFARDHFAKEERALFPMAHEILGDDVLHAMGRAWADARRVTLADVSACGGGCC